MAAMASATFLSLALQCGLSIHPATRDQIVEPISSFNSCPIGVVGKVLPREPRNTGKAVMMETGRVTEGVHFGNLAQVSRQSLEIANSDLNQILPGQPGSFNGAPSAAQLPAAAQPSYESWDVLRQYPRTAPLSQPQTAAPKPQENPNSTKDSKDAQSKTATE